MKKLKLFTLGLLGASLFMTSCAEETTDSEVGPSLTVTEANTGITDGGLTVTVGEEVYFSWEARKGTSDLDKFEVERDGFGITGTTVSDNVLPYSIKNADDELYVDSYSFIASSEGTSTFDFIVTDKNGLKKTQTVNVTIEGEATPLGTAESFTWTRDGGSAATGLAQFGLKWTHNTSTSAIVTTDAATRFVKLESEDWSGANAITSVEELGAAIEGAAILTSGYSGVSATASGTYDDVLGVRYNDEYYLLHITQATVGSGTAGGTKITINGQYKM